MTEQQAAIKQIRKVILRNLGNAYNDLPDSQKKKTKECLEINIDIKKDRLIISTPLSFARYLERV